MKLHHQLIEALDKPDRRDFLRQTGGAVAAAATGDFSSLLKAATKTIVPAVVGRYARQIAAYRAAIAANPNLDQELDYTLDERLYHADVVDPRIPIDVMTGKLATLTQTEPERLLALVVSGDDHAIGRISAAHDDVITNFYNGLATQLGPRNFVKLILDVVARSDDDWQMSRQSFDDDYDVAGGGSLSAGALQAIARMVPSTRQLLGGIDQIIYGDPDQPIKFTNYLRGKGLIEPQHATSSIQKFGKRRREYDATMKKLDRDLADIRQRRDAQDAELKRPVNPEHIDVPPDYYEANPMHQPFERRLAAAFAI